MTAGPSDDTRRRRVRRAAVLLPALCCVAGALGATSSSVGAEDADPLVELRRLSAEGRTDRALSRLPGLMAAHPDDPRLPFEKALLLTSQRRTAEAIAVYQRMVTAYPGLPEPLNNLGVLYATTGDLERAQAAFQGALNTQESVRTAYANLGHVNMRLAGRAYAKALHIDDGPHALALVPIQQLPSSAMPAAPGVAASVALPTLPASTALPAREPQLLASLPVHHDPPKATGPAPASTPPAQTATAPAAVAASGNARTAALPVPPGAPVPASAAAPKKPPPSSPDAAPTRDVQSAIAAWASAWSQKNVDAYVASYVPGYKASEASAAAWQAARRVRILGKSRIAVGVSRVAVVIAKDGSATASFRQTYVADQLNVSSGKTLEFVRQGGKWLIRRELAGS